jgi:hypothetical protein
VVAPLPTQSRGGLAALAAGLLTVGLLALLMINIDLGKGAFELTALQRERAQLVEQRQALQEQIETNQAPQRLAAMARSLGMVPAPNTAFLQLPDGRVIGEEAAAPAPVRPATPVMAKPRTARTAPATGTARLPKTGKAKPVTSGAAEPAKAGTAERAKADVARKPAAVDRAGAEQP